MKKLKKRDKWVKPFLKKYKGSMTIALFLGVCMFICSISLMFNSGYLISKAATMPINILMIYVPVVLTRAFGIGRPAFRYAEQLTSHNWVLKMVSGLRLKLYKSLENDAVFLTNHQKLGNLLSILNDDVDNLENLYLITIFPTVVAWIVYTLVVLFLGFCSLWFALFVALYLLILLLLMPTVSIIFNGYRIEKEKYLKSKLYNDLTDNILGISDWIFSQNSERYIKYHNKYQSKLYRVKDKEKHFNSTRYVIFQGIILVLILIVLVWSTFNFKASNKGYYNWIAAFVLSVFPLSEVFMTLSSATEQKIITKDSIRRLNNLPEPNRIISPDIHLFTPFNLKISNLTFHYPHDKEVILNNINLDINYKEKIAILGKSGSGKSTLLSLLRGDLKPTEGLVTLNGYNTYELNNCISDYVGVIDQSPYLFNTTILNNIRMGNENASIKDIWDVLKKVRLDNLIKSLPNGLSTKVEEAGKRFSGGERQRIALARILLKNPPIILLDEPTVGLDPMTEQSLIDTFFSGLKDHTIIWVTHHLQGIGSVDKVIFIEDGKMELNDSPNNLLKTNKFYRQLKEMDAGYF